MIKHYFDYIILTRTRQTSHLFQLFIRLATYKNWFLKIRMNYAPALEKMKICHLCLNFLNLAAARKSWYGE